jgi:acetyl esterase/lipase
VAGEAGRHRSCVRWLVGGLAGILVVVAAAAAVFVIWTRNPSPGAFYDPPSDVPDEPGTIIRSERFTDGIPDGARGWRVLYASTDEEGEPIAVSGLIVAPDDPPSGPLPVLAWAHGTTGVVPACAPSLSDQPLQDIPDMVGPLEEGWVITMTDYPGLGTPGPHPYLVGGSEGRAVLDAVRAAHRLDIDAELDDRYAIWGHSQGGHAALFAGQLAASYVPEHDLVGVAALAPATGLQDDFEAIEGTEVGNVLTIFALHAWSRYYPDINDDVLTRSARRPARRIADDCLNQPSRFRIVVEGLGLPDHILDVDITQDPTWTPRLDENTPTPDGVTAPLFVGQGLADEVVAPHITQSWIDQRCAAGAPTELRTYPGLTHLEVVGPGGTDALRWTIDRVAGNRPGNTC